MKPIPRIALAAAAIFAAAWLASKLAGLLACAALLGGSGWLALRWARSSDHPALARAKAALPWLAGKR